MTRHDRKEAAVQLARNNYCTDDLGIDDNPQISSSDEGMWVAAWVWVSNAEIDEQLTPDSLGG